MEFDGEVVKFDVYKTMRHPDNVVSINFIDIIDVIGLATEEFIGTNSVSNPCRELKDSKEKEETIKELEKKFSIESNPHFLPSKSKISHSILQTPDIELKPPPEQLREGYALSMVVSKLKKIRKNAYMNNRTYKKETKELHDHRISLKEILSWTKCMNWRKS
ncbi:hypothetical protein V6N11_011127 [Hibiscus sabdariffa]|uniref:Uncharacterized protein n=1 Tax=Hibiscus sabdariffa TaxID=183260 RepID=A0ABR2S7Q4_9ROSI